jgi:hypothetical protein
MVLFARTRSVFQNRACDDLSFNQQACTPDGPAACQPASEGEGNCLATGAVIEEPFTLVSLPKSVSEIRAQTFGGKHGAPKVHAH